MRSAVAVLVLLVSSCGGAASEPAVTPVIAKIEIESAPPEPAASAPASHEPESAGGADTEAKGEALVVEDEGGAEAQASAAPVARIRTGKVVVSGALPQEVVERIVRQGYGRVRMCYERGLARDPSIQGTVNASFVIESDGSVSNPRDMGSSLSDPTLVKCVVSTFYGCSFPQPESGTVSVDYSLTLSPH